MARQVQGFLIPTTNVWDVSEIYDINVNSYEFKELLIRLYQNLNNMALSINIRDAGYYATLELLNGQSFFPDPVLNSTTPQNATYRAVFRKVIDFGALPNTAAKSVAHGIACTIKTSFTRIYATSSRQDAISANRSYIPIPFASPVLANNISIELDDTNVTITTGSNRSLYNVTYVVLEYLQT